VNSTKLSDSRLLELVRAATKRDPEAVECLFVVLLPRVRNLVRYLTRGDPEVDDLSQDALVVILRGLSTYRADGPFYAWADRVVARSVFRTLKQRRQSAVIPLDELKPCQLKPPSVEPEADFARRRQLVLALDQLPLEQRMTLVLRYVLGFSVKEIAREWDVPEETVRSRLRLGKNRLRGGLQAGAREGDDPSLETRQMVG